MELSRKLEILAAAARYDASCASSGVRRGAAGGGLGSATPNGVCHSWSEDGRCISLLKVLLTNECCFDCRYCANRRSNDLPRASFSVAELVWLTVEFYRRNYIEGLFLSSAVRGSADATMERLCEVVQRLRRQERFGGYIHLKVLPGVSPALLQRAGLYADRLSVNIELPSAASLVRLAPQKRRESILEPMRLLEDRMGEARAERQVSRYAPPFAPAGQSTQLIVGASPESDYQILRLADSLYRRMGLRRVYYSAYLPVGDTRLLPAPDQVPLRREHRLYQADWLLRHYGFAVGELLEERQPFLDERLDPKSAWALRHPERFPVEINRAEYGELLRVPGIGARSAQRIVQARRVGRLRAEDLAALGVAMRRARYFIRCDGRLASAWRELCPEQLMSRLLGGGEQLPLFAPAAP